MSGPGTVTHGGQQPILTLVLHDPIAEKATAQKLADKTKTLTLVLRDPPQQKTDLKIPHTITIVLHDPVKKKQELKESIALVQQVLYGINEKLNFHVPEEGYLGERKITVLTSATVNSRKTQADIESIKKLLVTVEEIESIISEHITGCANDLKTELEYFHITTTLLKGRCNVLLSKQQTVSNMQAQASRIHNALFNVSF